MADLRKELVSLFLEYAVKASDRPYAAKMQSDEYTTRVLQLCADAGGKFPFRCVCGKLGTVRYKGHQGICLPEPENDPPKRKRPHGFIAQRYGSRKVEGL